MPGVLLARRAMQRPPWEHRRSLRECGMCLALQRVTVQHPMLHSYFEIEGPAGLALSSMDRQIVTTPGELIGVYSAIFKNPEPVRTPRLHEWLQIDIVLHARTPFHDSCPVCQATVRVESATCDIYRVPWAGNLMLRVKPLLRMLGILSSNWLLQQSSGSRLRHVALRFCMASSLRRLRRVQISTPCGVGNDTCHHVAAFVEGLQMLL